MPPPSPELLASYQRYLRVRRRWFPTGNDGALLQAYAQGRMSQFGSWRRDQARTPDMEETTEDDRPTFRWSDEQYQYMAQIVPDDDHENVAGGSFSDHEPTAAEPHSWLHTWRCPRHGRSLVMGHRKCPVPGCTEGSTLDPAPRRRGPESRHWWTGGGYRRDPHKWNSREFNYGHVDYFTYYSTRCYYWLSGHSRRNADLLSRAEFTRSRWRLEEWGRGNLGAVGVVVTLFSLDGERELADDSLWGIESDYDDHYIVQRMLECASEAKHIYESKPSRQPPSQRGAPSST